MTTEASTDRLLMQVQAASGALFALFLAVHLGNTMLAALGPAAYDAAQGQLRAVYQVPAIEVALVLGPLVVHVAASVWRMLRRRRLGQPQPRALRSRLQRYSAVVLLVFIAGHVLATRGPSLVFGVWPNFDALAFTMIWNPAYFIPYYALFAVAGLYHLIQGLALALPRLGARRWPGLRSQRVVFALASGGALLLVLGVAGFAGAFSEVREGAVDGSYARLLEELGLVDRAAIAGAASE